MTSVDIETVFEMWEKIKAYSPAKEKLDVAEIFIRTADDVGALKEDVHELVNGDKILEAAYDRYYADDFEEEEDDWE